MKTLRFVFFALLLAAASNVFAQGNKSTYCYTYKPFYIPCVYEFVYGELEHCYTMFDSGKMQVKIKGEVIGSETESIYTVILVNNINIQNWNKDTNGALSGTETYNLSIVKDGEEIGVLKQTVHITINANGEWTSEVYKSIYECF